MEVDVTSLPEDQGDRLARYARALPTAIYVVADVPHRRVLIHTDPRPAGDPAGAGYAGRAVVGPGEAIRLRIDGADLEPFPFEEVMR